MVVDLAAALISEIRLDIYSWIGSQVINKLLSNDPVEIVKITLLMGLLFRREDHMPGI